MSPSLALPGLHDIRNTPDQGRSNQRKAILLQMAVNDSHETPISPSSNTRFFSTAHRCFTQSCLNIWKLLKRTLHICLFFSWHSILPFFLVVSPATNPAQRVFLFASFRCYTPPDFFLPSVVTPQSLIYPPWCPMFPENAF